MSIENQIILILISFASIIAAIYFYLQYKKYEKIAYWNNVFRIVAATHEINLYGENIDRNIKIEIPKEITEESFMEFSVRLARIYKEKMRYRLSTGHQNPDTCQSLPSPTLGK